MPAPAGGGMSEGLAAAYPWVKSLHILSIIAWMAGLLYLPRLFVYHADAPAGSALAETFKVMERRLLRGIMTPAMIASYVFGALLAATPGIVDWSDGWIYAKLAMVAGLTVVHHLLGAWRQEFAADRNRRSARFYRAVNEVPTLLLIAIVFLVVLKPF
jgi:putative membrane protein